MAAILLLLPPLLGALAPLDSLGGKSSPEVASLAPELPGNLVDSLPATPEPTETRPLGEGLEDPLPPARVVSTRLDSLVVIPNGALEGSKALTPGDSLVYVWAEWTRDHLLHNRTRPETVERRLLFRRGDAYDSLRWAESERLLRQERFLADAKVRTRVGPDGRTSTTVETWDKWSTSVLTSLNRSGGEVQWLLGVSEANLLGSGRSVGGYYQSTVLRTSWNVGFLDNAFLRQGHLLSLNLSQASDGNTYALRLGRPLSSRFQDLAWMFELDDATTSKYVWGDAPLWHQLRREHPSQRSSDWSGFPSGGSVGPMTGADRETFSAYPLAVYQESRSVKARAWAQKVWGSTILVGTGPMLEHQFDRLGTLALSSSIPASLRQSIREDERWAALRDGSPEIDDRRIGWMTTVRRDRWIRRRNFNNLKWVEDIPVGWLAEANVVRSVISRGEDRDATWSALSGRWSGLLHDTYAVGSASWIRRFGGESTHPDRQGLAWKAELRQLVSPTLQTLATASGDLVSQAPPTSQLTLGEDNGLPGFPAHTFAGTSRSLFGSEVRWTPPVEALTIAPALAAFAGAGRIGDKIRPLGSGEWHYGAGVGLRFGLTRSINSVVNHISIARPLGPEGGDWNETASWMLSFGSKTSL